MIATYEAMVIADVALGEEERTALINRTKEVIVKAGGTPRGIDRWGKRSLAYKIKHQDEGYYLVMGFDMDTGNVTELDRHFHLTDAVVRHRITRLPEGIEPGVTRRTALKLPERDEDGSPITTPRDAAAPDGSQERPGRQRGDSIRGREAGGDRDSRGEREPGSGGEARGYRGPGRGGEARGYRGPGGGGEGERRRDYSRSGSDPRGGSESTPSGLDDGGAGEQGHPQDAIE